MLRTELLGIYKSPFFNEGLCIRGPFCVRDHLNWTPQSRPEADLGVSKAQPMSIRQRHITPAFPFVKARELVLPTGKNQRVMSCFVGHLFRFRFRFFFLFSEKKRRSNLNEHCVTNDPMNNCLICLLTERAGPRHLRPLQDARIAE